MEAVKRFIGSSILSLARFIDTYFVQLAAVFIALAIYNYFFIKNYDKILLESARDGKIKELKDALRNGGDVNAAHAGEYTPLIMACGTRQEEAVSVLLETGKCKIDAVDGKGRSALLVASGAGLLETVKLLLKNKADVKASDNNGSTPLIVACRKHSRMIANGV
jgi:ankyrin repeat protein